MVVQLITRLFTGEASIYFNRLRTMATIYAIMSIVALALVFFLLLALFIWIAQSVGALAAAIWFAAACLVILIGTYIVLTIARRPPRQRAADRMQRDVASIASIAAVSNMPLLFRSIRRRKSLLLVPVAAISAFGLFRAILGLRNGSRRS